MAAGDPVEALDEAVSVDRWDEVDRLAAELSASLDAPEVAGYGAAARDLSRAIKTCDLDGIAAAYARLARLRDRIAAGRLDPPERRATLGWWKR